MNILEAPQAKSYFSGIVDLKQEDGGWFVQRLTERQLKYYAANEAWAIRSRCAAGIVLQFRTDALWIDLELENLGGARAYLGIDVEVDGRIVESVALDKHEGKFQKRILDYSDSPNRLRNVSVYLPCSTIVKLCRVELASGAVLNSMPIDPKHLLCLGDSITQGMDAVSPYATYPTQLAKLLKAELLNQAVGGHVFDEESLVPTPGMEPDIITVSYGTNDWSNGMSVDELHHRLSHYLAKLEDMFPDARTYVISPIWRTNGSKERGDGMNLAEFGRRIRQITSEFRNIRAVDGFTLVPNQERFFVDGAHPNELGFMHYAINLARRIL